MPMSYLSSYQLFNALEKAFTCPARSLTKSRGKNIHRYASIKMRCIISVESTLEFDSCFHFDFQKEIIRFCAQPIRFSYELNGKEHTYVPDFLVQFDCGEFVLYEVKTDEEANSERFKLEFEAKKLAAQKLLGVDLELIKEQAIRIVPLLNNLKLMHRYSSRTELTEHQRVLLSILQKNGVKRIENLMYLTGFPSQSILPMIYDLLSRSLFQTDLYSPLNKSSKLGVACA